jgi:Ala-tRNA(Pro) deacylase
MRFVKICYSARMQSVEAYFQLHAIPYRLYEHPPVFTVADVHALGLDMPGVGAKNLFLKDLANTRYFLLVLPNTMKADLKAFARIVGEKKVTFGTPDELMQYLGITPGSVSLCCLLNDDEKRVHVYVHEAITDADIMHLHPNRNTASVELTKDAFAQFLTSLNRVIHRVSDADMPLSLREDVPNSN